MERTKLQGNEAEDMALEYLLKKGLSLRERNWRNGHREVDIIMESHLRLHIVEVKSLNAPIAREPFENVDAQKRRNLIRAAQSYVAQNRIRKEVQFDIVSIVFDGDTRSLEYIPDAFLPIMTTNTGTNRKIRI